MTSAITPFAQWIQTLRYDIMNILQSYKGVCIHRAKLACLCTELHAFYQKMSTKHFPQTPPNPSEASHLRNAVSQVSALRQTFLSFDQNHSIMSLISTSPEQVRGGLNDFRRQFNVIVMALKIVPAEPFKIDPDQEKTDDFADCKLVVEILTNYLATNALKPDVTENINHRLQEYKEEVQKYESKMNRELQTQQNLTKILTQEDIDQRISPIVKWKVPHEDFELQKKIGAGGFADVYSGYQKSTHKVVAIKKLHTEEFNEQTFRMFLREVEIIGTLQHFAVLPFVGVCTSPPFYIITEFMSGGCLFNRIHAKETRLDGTKKTILALGIAYAMQYIHQQNYIHRDLKSLNILLDADDYPKVCDFGMSRIMPESDEPAVLTGGAGTVQWMAPEVLNSDPYDKKADVYSYGIMLWEIMTNEVPFRGLRDVQVAMAVVGNCSRPMIPADNVGRLGRFIKMCWDQDPKKRPTFDHIVAAFESGNVYYPGTNINTVNAYCTRFINKPESVKPTKPLKSDNASIDSIAARLYATETAAGTIEMIAGKIDDTKYIEKLAASTKILPALFKACDICDSSDMAANIIKIFSGLSQIPKLLNAFCVQKVMSVFVHFGTTQMKEILDFIKSTVKIIAESKLNGVQLNKFGAFLQSSDISLRTKATERLLKMLKYDCYDRTESLKTILSFVIQNANSDSVPELLLPSLKIVIRLLPLEDLSQTFTSCGIFTSVISVFTSKQSSKIYTEASSAISIIIKKLELTEDDMKQAISSLPEAVNKLPSEILPHYLAVFSNLLGIKLFYTTTANNRESAGFFSSIFKSNSAPAILLGLKLCFALLKNDITRSIFASIASVYIKLITSRISAIASIAAACLVQSAEDVSAMLTDEIADFFNMALESENAMSLNGLRLCGAVASSQKGATFLEDRDIIRKVSKFVNSDDETTKRLAIMVYAAYSSSRPISDAALSVVPKIIDELDDAHNQQYAVVFLSNAAIHPSGAIACAQQLSKFAKILVKGNTNKAIVIETLNALLRVVTCPEAIGQIRDSTPITEIYRTAEGHMKDELFGFHLELISCLSGTVAGARALGETNLKTLLRNKLDQMPEEDSRKSIILRILARCSTK